MFTRSRSLPSVTIFALAFTLGAGCAGVSDPGADPEPAPPPDEGVLPDIARDADHLPFVTEFSQTTQTFGVTLHLDDEGWFVAIVDPGSDAELAGLEVGQRVVSYNRSLVTADVNIIELDKPELMPVAQLRRSDGTLFETHLPSKPFVALPISCDQASGGSCAICCKSIIESECHASRTGYRTCSFKGEQCSGGVSCAGW